MQLLARSYNVSPHIKFRIIADLVIIAYFSYYCAITQIGSLIDRNGSLQCINPKQIIVSLRFAAEANNLVTAGFNLRRIGSHSLRSGGTDNLKLNGYDHDIIKKLGRWSSNTYLHYIQNSIGELTTGVAMRMATTLRFHRVGT